MASSSGDKAGSGGDFLARRSDAARSVQGLPALIDVLIIEDETFDADRLAATLRVLFGYKLGVRRAPTLGQAIDRVLEKMPEIVFLDDVLKPSDTASDTIPYLHRAGYHGPIVVVSGKATRQRKLELSAAGAADVIHKDDVDSVRLAEALARVFAKSVPATDD